MSSKLRVEELRSQLTLRGLDARGTKAMLVKRLESAMQIEEEKEAKEKKADAVEDVPADGVLNSHGKRKRGSVDPDDDRKEEELDGEKLKKCTVREKEEKEKKADAVEDVPVDGVLNSHGKRNRGSVDSDADRKEEELDGEKLKKCTVREKEAKEKKADAVEDVPADGVLNSHGKRNMGSVDPDDDRKEKELDGEKLKKCTVRELKALANRRGVSASGTKGELVKRLSGVEDQKDTVQEEKAEVIEEEKLVTATKKGGAVLDQWLPDDIKTRYHVLQKGVDSYDATLNQTNVGDNNNKFYVIQALESDNGGSFMVFCRWGRVGVKGQSKLHGPFSSQESAIHEFHTRFYEKTKNQWCDRKKFVSHPKCYTWLEMDYSEAGTEQMPPKVIKSIETQLQETKLEGRVAKFVSLVCNITMMKQQMLEIGYNAEKLPLGKLSQSTILKGYDVLRRISDMVQQGDKKKLEQLSGEFYTVIPHDFGFKKMRDFVIDTPFKVKSKIEMVSALGEIEIATRILNDDPDSLEDPLYSHYQHLCCELIPVEIDSKEFSMAQKYINNTHAETHSSYTVDIVHLFRVSRKGEDERFQQFSNVKNRMLLWHGSRLTNWTGILSQEENVWVSGACDISVDKTEIRKYDIKTELCLLHQCDGCDEFDGLRIAPPEAPVTGYMFGKGVYFADMFSKSANYCFTNRDSAAGVLLLCEVALGDMAELHGSNYHADLLPEGKLSTKGVGVTEPDMSQAEKLEDGVVVPLGKPKKNEDLKSGLLYNEYIVYNVEQIRMRYLIQVNFNYKW